MKTKQLAVTLVLAASTAALPAPAQTQTRYFSFVTPNNPQSVGSGPRHTFAPHEFVFAVNDPAVSRQIEAIIENRHTGPDVHVEGRIVRGRVAYNEEYPFHLDPNSIRLFSNTTEQCSATAFEVEEHLELVGVPDSGFLDRGIWCPWDSRLVREIDRRTDP